MKNIEIDDKLNLRIWIKIFYYAILNLLYLNNFIVQESSYVLKIF